MVKAIIKHCYSPDVTDLFSFQPTEGNIFGFNLRFILGPADEEYQVLYDIFLCSPEFLKTLKPAHNIIYGRHLLIVLKYDFNEILDSVAKYVSTQQAKTWDDLIQVFEKIGKSEFEEEDVLLSIDTVLHNSH